MRRAGITSRWTRFAALAAVAAAVVLVPLAALAAGRATGSSPRPARPRPAATGATGATSADPTVSLSIPYVPLRAQVTLNAYATPASGQAISSVAFQISAAGAGQWQTFDTETAPAYGSDYQATLDTTDAAYVPQNGLYDLRAVATDSAGDTGISSVQSDQPVANNATYVALADTGSPLSGDVTLTATPEAAGSTPDTVTFQESPAGADDWKTIATVPAQVDRSGDPTGNYVTRLATWKLPSGAYDLQVTAEDSLGDAYVGGLVPDIVVDNVTPSAQLANPGSSLSGVVTLTASAHRTPSGIAAVRFEVSPAGGAQWSTIAVATAAPYTVSFDTRQLQNGAYDLRAQAVNSAGLGATSPVIGGVAIANSATSTYGDFTVTDYVAPASHISLLGEPSAGADGETWAYGYTNAPPPTVDGTALPYTAQGHNQLVLLRYTDATGWQIVDVLRTAGGAAFDQIPGATLRVSGAMTGSGEAWIAVDQAAPGAAGVLSVFHRIAGGQFDLDPAATAALAPLVGTASGAVSLDLRLGETAGGAAYGLLLDAGQQAATATVQSPTGPVGVQTQLGYGQLTGGVWSTETATLPPDLTVPSRGVSVALAAADPTGPGTGWGVLSETANAPIPLMLARFDQSGWHFTATGLDALDLTGAYAATSPAVTALGSQHIKVTPTALRADAGGVWISADVKAGAAGSSGSVVAYYDAAGGSVTQSWCSNLPVPSADCAQPLDLDHPAAVPDEAFSTADGPVADVLADGFVNVYAHGVWTSVPAPGFDPLQGQGQSLFADPNDGWLVGANSLGQVSPSPPSSLLAAWPQANRNPLLSVALPPGASTTDTAGALAVGLNGTALHYTAAAGWQTDPTPPQIAHLGLYSVAFDGPASAFAVGEEGTILRWNGTTWSQDPQSNQLTTAGLNAVAFASDGEGWAVGAFGTILHYQGGSWSADQLDPADAGTDVTSVTVAGGQAYAIAAGNLLARAADGTWQRVPSSLLPSPAPPAGSLALVSGLPDGGLAIAGRSQLIVRESASSPLTYSAQSFQGIPVALAAFRDGSGEVQAYVSVAPPVEAATGPTDNVGGFPAGDGDLLLATGDGWEDLSRSQFPTESYGADGDGVVQPDPVLAVAASADGSHAWAVGGYAGTLAADGIGTTTVLSARPSGWLTSAIWRYDAGASVAPQAQTSTTVSLPAQPHTVSFAFLSSALCEFECADVQDAQPDVNLETAASQIAAFARQPGGPAFAMLGGNARGPMDQTSFADGNGAIDLARLGGLLAPLAGVPTYAAYGPRDAVPTSTQPAAPWAQAFADAPAPFGSGPVPSAFTALGAGDATGAVNKYYAFDVAQNGGTLCVIVLDNSAGTLEASAPGQSAWLTAQLAAAKAAGTPVVVVAARPLSQVDAGAATDGNAVAAQLAAAGVLGVFTTSGGASGSWAHQPDREVEVPANAAAGAAQVPEYEGAALTYQQPENNGVLWYDVSINTASHTLSVDAIPVIASLALDPIDGLTAHRSSTLDFQAIGRRPAATIATTPTNPSFPGFDQYVGIPSATCSGCIGPSYTFSSSDPTVGTFVLPSSPGSTYPKLSATGQTTPSSTSGLFCAFNSGTTTVSVTSGLLTASLPVTVAAGGFGPPCGTVPGGVSNSTVTLAGRVLTSAQEAGATGAPASPPPATHVAAPTPKISLPAAPAPVKAPAPAPVVHQTARHAAAPPAVAPPAPVPIPAPSTVLPAAALSSPPVATPIIPPAATPVPPGGAGASATASAKREERARKHANQSAFSTPPAGADATEWFFPLVGVVSLLALLLIGTAARPAPRHGLAFALAREETARSRPRRRPRP